MNRPHLPNWGGVWQGDSLFVHAVKVVWEDDYFVKAIYSLDNGATKTASDSATFRFAAFSPPGALNVTITGTNAYFSWGAATVLTGLEPTCVVATLSPARGSGL